MGYFGFYIFGTFGFAFIAYLLIKGSINMRDRSNQPGTSLYKQYESLVATGMFIGGIVVICMILLVVFSLLAE